MKRREEGGLERNIQDFSEMMGMEGRGGNIETLSEMRRRGKY